MDRESKDELVEQLLSGYDSLNAEARLLQEQQRQLENKLAWAKQQVCLIFFLPIDTVTLLSLIYYDEKPLALDLQLHSSAEETIWFDYLIVAITQMRYAALSVQRDKTC